MPCAAPAIPRKMLPPPITRQISSPLSRASLTSCASAETTAGSIPNCCSPISTSPESLSSTRLTSGIGMGRFSLLKGRDLRALIERARGVPRAKQAAPAPPCGSAFPCQLAPLQADRPHVRQVLCFVLGARLRRCEHLVDEAVIPGARLGEHLGQVFLSPLAQAGDRLPPEPLVSVVRHIPVETPRA